MTKSEMNNFKISVVKFRDNLELNSGFYNKNELNEIKTNLEIIKREITRAQNIIAKFLNENSKPLF
jgi:hypothetical protein